MKISKEEIIKIICAIVLVITTIYLWDKLYGYEKIALGIWGLAIFIGTIVDEKKKKKEPCVNISNSTTRIKGDWENFFTFILLSSFMIPLSITFLLMFYVSKSFLLGGIIGMGIMGVFFSILASISFNKYSNGRKNNK